MCAMAQENEIKTLRKALNWDQGRMARYLGVDRSSVSHMENGRPVRGPVKRLLETLAAAAERGEADALCPDLEAAE
jgi:transcriptional regulator with XRE-family HTH domain